jgi:hypothetical protein
MDSRWLPVVAAILGVLGGVAGAAVGGYIANKGQEQQFEAERAARMLDMRIDAYVRFLVNAQNEADHASDFDDSVLEASGQQIALLARSAELRRAAATLSDSARFWDDPGRGRSEYTQALDDFVALANAEIEAAS